MDHNPGDALKALPPLSPRGVFVPTYIIFHPESPSIKPDHIAGPVDFPGSPVPDSRDSELPVPNSYYPARIMGYLSFDEDQEAFSALESTTDLESGVKEVTNDFLNTQ